MYDYTALMWGCDNKWKQFFIEHNVMLEGIFRQIAADEKGFFPYMDKVFRFTAIEPDKVKGVIVGMDPYPTYTVSFDAEDHRIIVPEATGRSFEVSSVDSWHQKFKQSSLRNFLKAIYLETTGVNDASLDEIRAEIAAGRVKIPPPHEWFNLMEGRGVMFLNLGLTVQPEKPGTHLKLWEPFTNSIAEHIRHYSPNAVWMLFGKDAQGALGETLKGCKTVYTCHPRLPEFVRERPFREIPRII